MATLMLKNFKFSLPRQQELAWDKSYLRS